MMRVLVVAPHADDAELGAGGYLARLQREGSHQLHVVLMSASDVYYPRLGRMVTAQERVNEQVAACSVVGANLTFLDVGDENRLDTADRGRMVAKLDSVIGDYNPDQVMIPLPSFNQDHRAVYEACLAAARPSPGMSRCGYWAYENPMQTWGTADMPGTVGGRCYVKLEASDLDRKVAALSLHRSQMDGRTQELCGPKGVMLLANMRGLEVGVPLAEMYYVLRQVV